MKNELAFDRTLMVNSTTGLTTAAGSDWDFYDGSKCGQPRGCATTATNMLYYEDLAGAAWLAGQLAVQRSGQRQRGDLDSGRRDVARPGRGPEERDQLAAVQHQPRASTSCRARTTAPTWRRGAAGRQLPGDRLRRGAASDGRPGSSSYLKNNLWGTFGPQPYSANAAYSTIISPFVSGFELDARFATGDTSGALALTRLMWAQMVNPSGPFYTGTLWEKLGQNGQITDSNASLAHGWATAPVSAFSSYLLGVQPVSPGLPDVEDRAAARQTCRGQGPGADALGGDHRGLGAKRQRRPDQHAGHRSGRHKRPGMGAPRLSRERQQRADAGRDVPSAQWQLRRLPGRKRDIPVQLGTGVLLAGFSSLAGPRDVQPSAGPRANSRPVRGTGLEMWPETVRALTHLTRGRIFIKTFQSHAGKGE